MEFNYYSQCWQGTVIVALLPASSCLHFKMHVVVVRICIPLGAAVSFSGGGGLSQLASRISTKKHFPGNTLPLMAFNWFNFNFSTLRNGHWKHFSPLRGWQGGGSDGRWQPLTCTQFHEQLHRLTPSTRLTHPHCTVPDPTTTTKSTEGQTRKC